MSKVTRCYHPYLFFNVLDQKYYLEDKEVDVVEKETEITHQYGDRYKKVKEIILLTNGTKSRHQENDNK